MADATPTATASPDDDDVTRVEATEERTRPLDPARQSARSLDVPRIGRYLVQARLGEGAWGVVYRAHDPTLDRPVALKLVRARPDPGEGSTAAEARLLHEAQALAKLNHPNVVTVYDVGTRADADGEREEVFIVMELVEGPTLAAWIETPRSPVETVRQLVAAGRGLAAAHAAGLVHRDIKPANIVVGDDGRVRVVDFGLARPTASADVVGHVEGTPRYMSPEQHRGEPADPRSDQFAFCVTAYQILFGTPPFAASTEAELARAKAAGLVRSPPHRDDVPAELGAVLLRGLAPDPRARFSGMEELLDELARHAEDVTEPAADPKMSSFSSQALDVLSIVLGRPAARRALGLVCTRAGRTPVTLDVGDLEILCRTLTPMLRTLAGRLVTERVLGEIAARTNKEGSSP
jgi:serine/threonine protein kinase